MIRVFNKELKSLSQGALEIEQMDVKDPKLLELRVFDNITSSIGISSTGTRGRKSAKIHNQSQSTKLVKHLD